MNEQDRSIFAQSLQGVAQVHDLIGRLFRVAEPGAVYSTPITAGDRTVVVTSEISMSVGAGAGFGSNTAGAGNSAASVPGGETPPTGIARDEVGGGGGGGGFSFGRPVAAVVIEPTGVRVEPIVDPTKLGIAFFTTLGAMFFAWTALRRSRNELTARQLALAARTGLHPDAKLAGDLRRLSRAEKHAVKKAAKETAKVTAKEAARLAAEESKKITAVAAKESKKAAEKAAQAAAAEAKKAAALAAKEAQAAKNAARMTAQHVVERRPW